MSGILLDFGENCKIVILKNERKMLHVVIYLIYFIRDYQCYSGKFGMKVRRVTASKQMAN